MSYNAEFGPSTRREGNKLKYKEIERKLYKKEKSQRKEQERRERPSSCRLGKTEKKALHMREKVLEDDNISANPESEPAIDEIESSRVIERKLKRPRRKVSLHVLKNNIYEISNVEEDQDHWRNYEYNEEEYDGKIIKSRNIRSYEMSMQDQEQEKLYSQCKIQNKISLMRLGIIYYLFE